jgi:hypothetical protein
MERTTKKKSHMQYVCCWNWTKDSWEFLAVRVDCLVIGIAAPNASMGMIKARLEAITKHVQGAISPLTETVYR